MRSPRAPRRYVTHVLRGFLMGAADVVPGVSGGTVALVLGIYPRLVRAVRTGASALGSAVRGRWKEFLAHFASVEWSFLLPLLAGIAIAVLSLAAVLERLLEDEPQNTAAVFFGLVAGSIFLASRLVTSWTVPRTAGAVTLGVIAFLVLGLRSDEVSNPAMALFLGAGAIAIVAMILPGISGSFILLMVGMYEAVLAAVNDRDLTALGVFIVGAIVGLALFSTLLDRLLRDHRDTTMALLIGLMTGSLRVLWPWPDGTETAQLAAPRSPFLPVVLALVGIVVVLLIGRLGARSEPSDFSADAGATRPAR